MRSETRIKKEALPLRVEQRHVELSRDAAGNAADVLADGRLRAAGRVSGMGGHSAARAGG